MVLIVVQDRADNAGFRADAVEQIADKAGDRHVTPSRFGTQRTTKAWSISITLSGRDVRLRSEGSTRGCELTPTAGVKAARSALLHSISSGAMTGAQAGRRS